MSTLPCSSCKAGLLLSMLAVALLVAFAGCKNSYEQQTAVVHGVVTLDGKPVATGWVFFTPQSGRAAKGAMRSDGAFTLGTYAADDGAIVGVHQVTVVARDKGSPGAEGKPGKSLIPERYSSPTISGLTFEVKTGETNVANLALTSK